MPVVCRRVARALVATVILLASMPSIAMAQLSKDGHWGVAASFNPTWTSHDKFREFLYGLDGDWDLEGSEFSIGLVRGSMGGGEWGVSFVRKPFKNGPPLVEVDSETSCFQNFCSGFTSTDTQTMQDVYMRGVEFHSFIPFVTMANRVQIGVNVGGGIAFPEGTFVETRDFVSTVTGFPPQTDSFTEVRPADEVMYKYVPLAKAEVQGAVIVAPGLKVKVSGGLNMPSAFTFRIGVVYLIGAN